MRNIEFFDLHANHIRRIFGDGRYVGICNMQIVDSDLNQRALERRMGLRFPENDYFISNYKEFGISS